MQAANFDNWNPFILCAGILALFTAGVFILGSWKVIVNMVAMRMAVVMAILMLPWEKVKTSMKVMVISILFFFRRQPSPAVTRTRR